MNEIRILEKTRCFACEYNCFKRKGKTKIVCCCSKDNHEADRPSGLFKNCPLPTKQQYLEENKTGVISLLIKKLKQAYDVIKNQEQIINCYTKWQESLNVKSVYEENK